MIGALEALGVLMECNAVTASVIDLNVCRSAVGFGFGFNYSTTWQHSASLYGDVLDIASERG